MPRLWRSLWPSCWSLLQECLWHSSPWWSPGKWTQVTRDTHWEQKIRCLQTGSERDRFNTSVFLTDLEPTPVPSKETEHKPYLIGVGRADCTGPPAEIPLVSSRTHDQPTWAVTATGSKWKTLLACVEYSSKAVHLLLCQHCRHVMW